MDNGTKTEKARSASHCSECECRCNAYGGGGVRAVSSWILLGNHRFAARSLTGDASQDGDEYYNQTRRKVPQRRRSGVTKMLKIINSKGEENPFSEEIP